MIKGIECAFAGFAALLVVILLLLSGGDASQVGQTKAGALKEGTVPAWAAGWLQRAATTCPEITAPVLAAQIQQESGWNPNVRSPAGAEGLAQFMPGTWAVVAVDGDGDGRADPHDPADAIITQAAYMCGLAGQLKTDHTPGDLLDLTLAAYNAGIAAVKHYGGIPPFPETQGYVHRIRGLIGAYSAT